MFPKFARQFVRIAAVLAPVLLTHLHGATEPWTVSASSWLGGSGSTDIVRGAQIQSDGTIVLAANLDNATPTAPVETTLLAGGNGAIVRLSADGGTLLSVTRLAAEVFDLSSDDSDNLYVAAATGGGVIKLDPTASTVLWQKLVGEDIIRIDASEEGYCVALEPASRNDNVTNGTGNFWLFDKDASGTQLTTFNAGYNALDVCVDGRTQTIIYAGWTNLFVYNGTYSRGYNGGTTTPVDIPYAVGVPFNFGDGGIPVKWRIHNETSPVWLDPPTKSIPNPRYVNYPFSTDPSNLWTQAEADQLEADQGRASDYYDYLVGNPKTFGDNMADTRAYRCTIGRDGKLYVGYESDGGNTVLRYDPFDLTQARNWSVTDGFFDVFSNTGTVPKIVIGRYELFANSAQWTGTFALTARLSDGSDNTTYMRGGALEADEFGYVYYGSLAFAHLPLPGHPNNNYPDFPRTNEIALDLLDYPTYLGGSYTCVMSPDLKTRSFIARSAGGWTRALDARVLDTNERANFVWGGYTYNDSGRWPNTVYTLNAVQASRLGSSTGSDGFFTVVNSELAAIRALPELPTEVAEGAPFTLDGTRSFSRDGTLTSWTWRDLDSGCLISLNESEVLTLPVGRWRLRLDVEDNLANQSSGVATVTVTGGSGNRAPYFESTPPQIFVASAGFTYAVATADSDSGDTLALSVVGSLPAGLSFTDLGNGLGELTGSFTNPGNQRILLSVSDGQVSAEQSFVVQVFEGGLGGILINDDFSSNTSSLWSFKSNSTVGGVPYKRWGASGWDGYSASGVLGADAAYHQGTTSTQSTLYYKSFVFPEDIQTAVLSTDGIHRGNRGGSCRAAVSWMDGATVKWAVSDQSIHTSSGSNAASVPGSWNLSSFTWKLIDVDDLNAALGAAVPSDEALSAAVSFGVASLGHTGTFLRNRLMQMNSLKLESFLDPTPNDPPVLSIDPVFTAIEGVPTNSAATATDPEATALTFTLESAPGWLVLSSTGPTTTDIEGTPAALSEGAHRVVLKVTDAAGQSAWECYLLRVSWIPPFLSIEPGGGGLDLHWPTEVGSHYQLQTKAALSDPSWTDYGAPVIGDGNEAVWTNLPESGDTSFYRLEITR